MRSAEGRRPPGLLPVVPVVTFLVAACAPLPPAPAPTPEPPRAAAPAPAPSSVSAAIARHRDIAARSRANGDLAAAADAMHVVLLLAPQDAAARRELGEIAAARAKAAKESMEAAAAAQRAGQTDRAIQSYLQALANEPALPEAVAQLRELDRQKYARIQQDRAARAKTDGMVAAAPAPAISRGNGNGDGDGYDIEQALEMLTAGDVAGGLRDLRAWVDANPRQRATRQRIGSAVYDKGRDLEATGAREQALSVYEAAVALRGDAPADWTAKIAALRRTVADDLYEAGMRLFRSDADRAIAKWEACLRVDPQHAKAAARLKEARALQEKMRKIGK